MGWIQHLQTLLDAGALRYVVFVCRFLLPILAAAIVWRCASALLRGRGESAEWAALSFPGGVRVPLLHWENILGRAASADVTVNFPSLSRTHAALIRGDEGRWRVYDLHSKGGVSVGGKSVPPQGLALREGAVVAFGGVDAVFLEPEDVSDGAEAAPQAPQTAPRVKSGGSLALLIEFQLLLGLCASIARWDALPREVPLAFAALILLTVACYIATRAARRGTFALETLALFLCTVGLNVTCSFAPTAALRQMGLLLAGLVLYFLLGVILRDTRRVKRTRWFAAAGGLGLLAVNLLFGGVLFGAKNWLSVGGFSFQPSEFVKVCFVFAGAATLERLFIRRNLLLFLAFSAACVGALTLMNDFGTALVFFVTYLVIAFMRSGDLATVFLSVAGAGFGGFLALTVKPYIAARFAAWGRAWEFMNDAGFQQTRTMAAAASGGLFGVGAGAGWLHRVFAADTDLVFGMVCEELGLLVALICVAALVVPVFYAFKSGTRARGSFYMIAACAAGALMAFQASLNVLGSVDILPLTGVTFPFVSRGGSSLISCWGLLAFVKELQHEKN